MQLRSLALFVLALTALSSTTAGQSFNIDFGATGEAPADDYCGAGHAGHWLSLAAPHNSNTHNLVDVNGVTTDVRLWQFGGTALLETDDRNITGDDAELMRDYLVTYSAGLESCLFFYNLDPGAYEVTLYARMPEPDILSYASCDEEPGFPHYEVGGDWPGGHVQGVTHVVLQAQVTSGLLRVHSGIVPGAPAALGAALNGIQIRQVVPIAGDVDADGSVGIADLLAVLGGWGACADCDDTCLADVTGDCTVSVEDLLLVLANWDACS